MTLIEEIYAKCSPELIASRNHDAIAAVVNAGRVKTVETNVGNGTILEVLGITVGNALLDVLTTQEQFRHVRPLIEQGRLRLDSPLVQGVIDGFVGTVLTAEQAQTLKNRCVVADPVSPALVARAMEGGI